jgi:hypothetical protein
VIADNALHSLRDHDGSLPEAVERISHLAGNKDDMRIAIAYLAIQVWTYRRASDEDAQLALHQIGTIIRDYETRKK